LGLPALQIGAQSGGQALCLGGIAVGGGRAIFTLLTHASPMRQRGWFKRDQTYIVVPTQQTSSWLDPATHGQVKRL
jgi:hypothetical protein